MVAEFFFFNLLMGYKAQWCEIKYVHVYINISLYSCYLQRKLFSIKHTNFRREMGVKLRLRDNIALLRGAGSCSMYLLLSRTYFKRSKYKLDNKSS